MVRSITMAAAKVGLVASLALALLALAAAPATGSVISAVGTATQIAGGEYDGWYKYTYTVTWDLSKGLSHWDLVLKPACLDGLHFFDFAPENGLTKDGQSTGETWDIGDPVCYKVNYGAEFSPTGDPSTNVTAPIIKWEPTSSYYEPGKEGTGQFWFYANVVPQTGTFDDVIVAKYGNNTRLGDLTGAYPSCNVIQPQPVPEPATMAMLAFGGAMVYFARRRGGK